MIEIQQGHIDELALAGALAVIEAAMMAKAAFRPPTVSHTGSRSAAG